MKNKTKELKDKIRKWWKAYINNNVRDIPEETIKLEEILNKK